MFFKKWRAWQDYLGFFALNESSCFDFVTLLLVKTLRSLQKIRSNSGRYNQQRVLIFCHKTNKIPNDKSHPVFYPRVARFELATFWFVAKRSIQLGYTRTNYYYYPNIPTTYFFFNLKKLFGIFSCHNYVVSFIKA